MAYQPKTEQFEHQRKVLELTWDKDGYALWWEPGTGKTKGFIDNGGMLYSEGAIDGMFMLAPNGLHRNFINKEIPKHLPDDIAEKARCLFWDTGKAKTKAYREQAREWLEHRDGIRILGMSYDGMMTEDGRALAKAALTSGRFLYGADEAQRIKDPNAKRTVRVVASGTFAPYRRILTGTPVANAPWDTWAPVKFMLPDFWRPFGLDSIEAMKASFGEWEKTVQRVPFGMAKRNASLQAYYQREGVPDCLRTEIVPMTTKEGKPVGALKKIPVLMRDIMNLPMYKDLDRLREILAPIRSRILKEDVFDLPPKLYTPVEFDLSPKQRKAYDQMRDLGFAQLAGKTCSTNMALTVMLRLQQIACGYLVADLGSGQEEPEVLPIEPNPRIDLLSEIVQDIPHQGIIWARYTPDIDAIMALLAKLGMSAVRYDGEVDDDQCEENENAFHRGEAQWFVSKPSKGGEGLTLTEAKTAIYYSNDFSLLHRLQSEDRPHRWGQDRSVNNIDLIARDTIDGGIVSSLIGKYNVASLVTGDNLRQWLTNASDPATLFAR